MAPSLFRLVHGSKMKLLEGIPGPEPSFPFGNALDFVGKRPWEVCSRYAREYGGLTLIWLAGRPALVLNDPKLIGEVLDSRANEFRKESPRTPPPTIIMDSGADWREWMGSQVAPMREMLREGIRLLKDLPEPVDVAQTVQHLGFDAFSVAFWSRVLGAEVYEWFLTLAKAGNGRMRLDQKTPLLPPLNPWFYAARRKWLARFSSLIQEAKAPAESPRSDLLSVLLRRGVPASDALRNGLTNLFFDGVFSTFSAVTLSLYLLSHNSIVEQRLRAELGALVERDPDYGIDALESCGYLDCVLREALRLYSPTPLLFRHSAKDRSASLGDHQLPPNTLLIISNWFLHHDPAHWNDSERFDPSRWEKGGAERDPFGSSWYFPFGRGPGSCQGQAFALFAMKLTLAEILIHSRLELEFSPSCQLDYFLGAATPKGLKGRFQPALAISSAGNNPTG